MPPRRVRPSVRRSRARAEHSRVVRAVGSVRRQGAGRLYLWSSLIGLWFTKQAIKPVQLPAKRAVPSFFAGWLTNELAFHHLAWQAAASAGFIRAGALKTWRGKLALLLTLVQWVGIGELIRRIFASRRAMQDALDQALSEFPGPLEEVESEESRSMRYSQLVFPFPPRHPEVERTRGIPFSDVGRKGLHLDVFRHISRPTRRPVILYVHGGAWMISNRDEQGLPLMHEMVSRGWVGVNADYRLSPRATFPDHLIDVKRAIAWVREHADEIGADPSFIAIAGGSAGAHLAALAALTPNQARYQPGFEDADTSVQAAVPIYGIYDVLDRERHHGYTDFVKYFGRFVMKSTPEQDPDAWHDASPIDQVSPNAPPFLIVHGSHDTLAPVAGAKAFASKLHEVSKEPVGYAELPGTQHAFDVFPSLRTAYILDAIAKFLQRARACARDQTDAAA